MDPSHGSTAPEVVHNDLPEPVSQQHNQYGGFQHQQYQPQQQQPYQDQPTSYYGHKPEVGGASAYSASHADATSPPLAHSTVAAPSTTAVADDEEKRGHRRRGGAGATFCGCSLLVFVLCAIIGLLLAAVIGLAAGTGVEASRANDANNKLAALQNGTGGATTTVTVTATAAGATSTSFAAIDDNCSQNAAQVSGTTYSAFQFFGNYTFTIQCNQDTSGNPILSLFAADLNTCMDHCAAYDHYIPGDFPNAVKNANTTCGAVSFIPLWTTKAGAAKGTAPGNCYLKPPIGSNGLTTPNIGTEVHAGVLNSS